MEHKRLDTLTAAVFGLAAAVGHWYLLLVCVEVSGSGWLEHKRLDTLTAAVFGLAAAVGHWYLLLVCVEVSGTVFYHTVMSSWRE